MRRTLKFILLLIVVALISSQAQGAFFRELGDLPGGYFFSTAYAISGDGSVIVGDSGSQTSGGFSITEAFLWPGISIYGSDMVGLGYLTATRERDSYSSAKGVSADGSVIVGRSKESGVLAFRWTENGGMVSIGDILGGSYNSEAYSVSNDGSVIVGWGSSASGTEAFRWTESEGMVGLGDLSGGYFFSEAYAVSANGAVIVGRSTSELGDEAYIWTENDGMVGLGHLETPSGYDHVSWANAVSANGSVVVGYSSSKFGLDFMWEAFIWSESEGMVGLGDLPGGYFWSQANAVSANGSVVVGTSGSTHGDEAFIWDSGNGMRRLKEVLIDVYSIDLIGWSLSEAHSLSDDGETIVGVGINPDGNQEAWLANISYVPAGDLNRDTDVEGEDLIHFIVNYANSHPDADLNGNGTVDSGDVEKFSQEFGRFYPNAYDNYDS